MIGFVKSLQSREAVWNPRVEPGAPDGRGFFSSGKEICRGKPDGMPGKAVRYGGKKTVRTAFSSCEYGFSVYEGV